MELELKIYTAQEVDEKAAQIGAAMLADIDRLISAGDIQTLSACIGYRLGAVVLNHNYWSKQGDTHAWQFVIHGNEGNIAYQQKMAEILQNPEMLKIAEGKQKAMADTAAFTCTSNQGSSKSEKAKAEIYKNFWYEWLEYLKIVADLARNVAMHRLAELKIAGNAT
jgi:hypothetical protein